MSEEIKNDSMVSINIVELASELAHQKLVENNYDEEKIINEDGTYTEDAQKLFDKDYDYYYNLIENCK